MIITSRTLLILHQHFTKVKSKPLPLHHEHNLGLYQHYLQHCSPEQLHHEHQEVFGSKPRINNHLHEVILNKITKNPHVLSNRVLHLKQQIQEKAERKAAEMKAAEMKTAEDEVETKRSQEMGVVQAETK